nr:MAG TPA: endonuclease-like protein [Caudoviricetes sp.]
MQEFLKESGNLLTENIPITKELLDFAKANNYKISLKTGAYQKEPISTTRGQKYNLDLLTAVHNLYYAGNLYLADFIEMFGITKLDDLAQVFKKNKLKMLTRKEVQNLYGEQIKQRTAETIDRKIEEGTRKPRKVKVPKIKQAKELKQPKIKVPKAPKPAKELKPIRKFQTKTINPTLKSLKASVTESGELLDKFKLVNIYLTKALKIAYAGHLEALDYVTSHFRFDDETAVDFMSCYQHHGDDAVSVHLGEAVRHVRKFTCEDTGIDVSKETILRIFDFVVFVENLVPIILEQHDISYESLTVGEFEFDYYIPERNLVIEVTNIPEFTDNLVDNQYFKRMNKSLSEKKIKLLRFGIDDVYNKTDLVISMIEHHLGLTKNKIPARKGKIVEITAKQAREFAEANHLNGHANAQVYYGLEFDGELVQIITFAKHRYNHSGEGQGVWEVIRACSKKHCLIQGGTQKIFKHFKTQHPAVELHTYCDMNISDGNSYALVGELIEETPGDLWYIIPDKYSPVGFTRVIRNRMMKIYLHRYFEGFPKRDEPGYKEINSVEFLRQRGIFAYYGSGNLVYKL